MVEKNELRVQITPYERRRIAVMAATMGSTDCAIEAIFATANRAKRWKISILAYLHEELGDILQLSTDLSERNEFGITRWAMTVSDTAKSAAGRRTDWGSPCNFARCDIQGGRGL